MARRTMGSYLLVFTNSTPGGDDEFNAWYSEHLKDILELDGFESARRFRLRRSELTGPAPYSYLAVYKAEEGRREVAEASLLHARTTLKEDGAPVLPLSPTLADERITWWFEDIDE